jgi:hypothetical protein
MESSISFKSSSEISFPRSSFSSSLKTIRLLCIKAACRWSVNLVRVSLPRKLRKTSCIHRGVEEALRPLVDPIGDLQANLQTQIENRKNTKRPFLISPTVPDSQRLGTSSTYKCDSSAFRVVKTCQHEEISQKTRPRKLDVALIFDKKQTQTEAKEEKICYNTYDRRSLKRNVVSTRF